MHARAFTGSKVKELNQEYEMEKLIVFYLWRVCVLICWCFFRFVLTLTY
jgi:hypothetical protein